MIPIQRLGVVVVEVVLKCDCTRSDFVNCNLNYHHHTKRRATVEHHWISQGQDGFGAFRPRPLQSCVTWTCPVPASLRSEDVKSDGASLDTNSELCFQICKPKTSTFGGWEGGVMRFSFGLIVNIWAATRKTTGSKPVQSHLIDV